jgi:hypothetical protein
MTTREEVRQRRIELLLDQLELAASNWVEAEYADGVETGRHGVVSAHVEDNRQKAMLKFRHIAARLRRAVRPTPNDRSDLIQPLRRA